MRWEVSGDRWVRDSVAAPSSTSYPSPGGGGGALVCESLRGRREWSQRGRGIRVPGCAGLRDGSQLMYSLTGPNAVVRASGQARTVPTGLPMLPKLQLLLSVSFSQVVALVCLANPHNFRE